MKSPFVCDFVWRDSCLQLLRDEPVEETAGVSDFACDLKMRMASLNILEVGPGHRTAVILGRFKFSCKGMLFHIKCDAGEQYFSEKPVITFLVVTFIKSYRQHLLVY